MLWVLRILNVLILVWGTVAYFSGKDMAMVLASAGLLFFVSALYKSSTVGSSTLRGRFWALFSMVGLTVGLAGLLHSMQGISLLLHTLSRLFLAASILMMFLGLVRRGMGLRGFRVVPVVLAFFLSVGAVIYAISVARGAPSLWHVLIGISDVLVFTFTVANLLIYLGSDLGRRWLIGFMATFVYILADMFFLAGRMEQALYSLVVSLFLISIVAHIGE